MKTNLNLKDEALFLEQLCQCLTILKGNSNKQDHTTKEVTARMIELYLKRFKEVYGGK